ncbi:MAG TPA: NADH-quinone oxidoreductase subunit NuoE [Bacteroidales bacterium]|jgi:NADH:ubiquinone oxidoreductase subunit E|nr:NADH-quinone oxidoreductase subunit NuoE [Bacteroidales bacterium]MDI9574077.1 NADH-quinone oxidoreductase subunit NuoE [Bacteroidota bacterium]OQC60567.1 MAG: NADH-quinone oxidoreductase subunit E [Bacteroidetes bacterium ADurb.Bin012]MBP9511954.1 NADH-quinone oxidoreductase subunit NuoE [Bacteroidales bacterium]MBP9588673.1 NADH-quinone oxidoreductase subunit NuoE [Bacteroidales bacterium]
MANTEMLVKELADKYGRNRESLLPILQELIDERRYVNDETMINVARELDLSAAEVYGTASFYSFIETEEVGKYVIRLCKTIVCDMKGKENVLQAIENTLKIKVGQTTADKKFTLKTTNCLGWCHKGPAMLINDEVYTELTPGKAIDIIESYINK